MKSSGRYILPSDDHGFIGRVYNLSIVFYNFDSFEEMEKHADCKYVYEVNERISINARRVESLNLVGDMLWPESPIKAENIPISLYEWLTISIDVFLMRFISVIDCSLQLVNSVYEAGLPASECKMKKLKQAGVSALVIEHLGVMLDEQARLRKERNERVHEGIERSFTEDDVTFRLAAKLAFIGTDRNGRQIDVNRSFQEGTFKLQSEFNNATSILINQLNALYDELEKEFEIRFAEKISTATHGLNAGAQQDKIS
ncbi:hypothetical protein [Methylobacterium sp. SyP6R]|uniref:hypothetical protein n=1 Tax=Methylobacterium sp. SyP6R TaxID=2718876 RepID=UPI001F17E474|nr:hypothetical protein [Methylobacterium sp. SyP6R]MCF4126409.1 hypothetical protein [Methylobacterium sp. SyP6R]